MNYHTLDFMSREWAHVFSVPDLRPVGTRSQPKPEPEVKPKKKGKAKAKAECDGGVWHRRLPGEVGTYGRTVAGDPEDYYVYLSLSQSKPMKQVDFELGLFYPERMFVWGYDDNDGRLSRDTLLGYLKMLGISSHPGFWVPCQVFHGYTKGEPTWHNAWRAEANIGPSWYSVNTRIPGNLPAGWEYNSTPGGGFILVPVEEVSVEGAQQNSNSERNPQ